MVYLVTDVCDRLRIGLNNPLRVEFLRTIIDDNGLQIFLELTEGSFDCTFEILQAVIGWNDHTDSAVFTVPSGHL